MNECGIVYNAIPNFKDKQNKDDERDAQLGFQQYEKVCIHFNFQLLLLQYFP